MENRHSAIMFSSKLTSFFPRHLVHCFCITSGSLYSNKSETLLFFFLHVYPDLHAYLVTLLKPVSVCALITVLPRCAHYSFNFHQEINVQENIKDVTWWPVFKSLTDALQHCRPQLHAD